MLNNKSIHDYIFYIILDNISFGILKNDYYKEHFDYLMALKDMEPLLFEGIYNNLDWPTQLEIMTASLGYVVIANSSIETTEIKDRVYVVYLPSNPNSYQLQELSKINPEFKQTNIDVSVEGNLK